VNVVPILMTGYRKATLKRSNAPEPDNKPGALVTHGSKALDRKRLGIFTIEVKNIHLSYGQSGVSNLIKIVCAVCC
jgi:hypothetical protein